MYSCLPRRSPWKDRDMAGRSYGVVKIFAFLELEPRLNFERFNWAGPGTICWSYGAGKIEHFSKVSGRRYWI